MADMRIKRPIPTRKAGTPCGGQMHNSGGNGTMHLLPVVFYTYTTRFAARLLTMYKKS